MAYYIGLMHHTDPKKYPKSPEALWVKAGSGEAGDWTMDQWKTFAFDVADNAEEHRD